jgi:integrase/recombinase XerD
MAIFDISPADISGGSKLQEPDRAAEWSNLRRGSTDPRDEPQIGATPGGGTRSEAAQPQTPKVARLRLLPASSGRPSDWNEACREFLDDLELRRYSPRTLVWHRSILGPFGRFLSSVRRVEDPSAVSEEDVREFLRTAATHGIARGAAVGARRLNHYREGIRRFYDWMRSRGYVEHNPAAGIAKIREPSRLIQALTEDQVAGLLRQPDRSRFVGLRDYCFLAVLLDTGVRLSEALGLRIADVDLDGAAATVIGKGDKQRRVGLSPRLVTELRSYLRRRETALADIGRPDSPWVFPSDVGGRLAAKTIQKHVRKYGNQAGITGVRVSPHTLRHTYALNFVRVGGDPFTLQKVLGHESLEMTRRYCELASADVLTRQREFSPLHTMDLKLRPPRRIPRKPVGRWQEGVSAAAALALRRGRPMPRGSVPAGG